MSAQRFTLRRGDTFSVLGVVRHDTSPQSLTGYTVQALLQPVSGEAATECLAQVIDAPAGRIRVSADPALTQALGTGMHTLVIRLVAPGSGIASSVGSNVWVI